MKSMTGYGKGSAAEGFREVTVELRCVNNRYLEIATKLHKSFLVCDEYLRVAIPKFVKRGTVDVFFSYANPEREGSIDADLPIIKQYLALAKKVSEETGITNDLTFTALMREHLITQGTKDDDVDTILRLTASATMDALSSLDKMRALEGEGIANDLKKLVGDLSACVLDVTKKAPLAVADYRAKLAARIADALAGIAVDEAKLINEVAFFADKADINEELQRLQSHISQFLLCIESTEPIGRKLEFICQEIGREINTLGSKSSDLTITGCVVEMKNILEKIKEQIRNIE